MNHWFIDLFFSRFFFQNGMQRVDAIDRASSRDTSIISCWTETLTVPFSNVERSVKRSRERDRRLKLEI